MCVQSKADAASIKSAVEQLLSLKQRLTAATAGAGNADAAAASKDKAKGGKKGGESKPKAEPATAAAVPATTPVAAATASPTTVATPATAAAPLQRTDASAGEKKASDKGKGKGDAKAAAAAAAAAAESDTAAALAKLGEAAVYAGIDIRVGVIVDAWEHPSSEKLWCEKIDVGEAEPREIGSGLRAFYNREGMVGARVLVVCNLKAIKLAGFPSNGMVLCTKGADGSVAFLPPPADAKPGDRLVLPGVPDTVEKLSPSQVVKQKLWEKIAPVLATNAEGLASVAGQVLLVNGKPCASKATNAPIT